MPSFKTISAILAVSGMVSAIPQTSMGRFTNSTTPSGSTGPFQDGATPTVDGTTYDIQTDTTYSGTPLSLNSKRQVDNSGLQGCLQTCSANSACVATSYDQVSCSYYSSIDAGSKRFARGVTFATVTSRAGQASSSGSGSGSAQPTGGMGVGSGRPGNGGLNGTAPGNGNGNGNNTSPALNDKFCPSFNLDIVLSRTGIQFQIECGRSHFGTIISIIIDLAKRAAPQSLDDCLDLCAQNADCAGTAFDTQAKTCTLFSDVQAAYNAPTVEFARRVTDGTTTVTAGQSLTSTIYSTNVVTISSCAPTVTNCPLTNGNAAVITQVVAVASTVYVCPVASTMPVAPAGCSGCPYVPSTATVYTSSGSSMVPVSTQVFNAPQPTGTVYSTITVACPTCPAQTAPATAPAVGATTVCTNCPAAPATTQPPTNGNVGPAPSGPGANNGPAPSGPGANNGPAPSGTGANNGPATSSMAVFMGAAPQVQAGMGMAAVIAGAVFMI